MKQVRWMLAACLYASASFAADAVRVPSASLTMELQRAIGLEHEGKTPEAERVLLNLIDAAKGRESLDVAVAMNNLGVLYAITERYADSERMFRRSIRALEATKNTERDVLVAKAKVQLATMLLESGRVSEAVKLNLGDLLQFFEDPEDRARVRGNLAALAMQSKRPAEAERMYVELLSFWRDPSRAGRSHFEIATILNNLGTMALWRKRPDAARPYLEESLALWEQISGPGSPLRIKALANVAIAFYDLKMYEEAASRFAEASASAQRVLGETHPFSVATQTAHAKALAKAGYKEDSKRVAKIASEARRSMRDPSIAAYTVDVKDMPGERLAPRR